MGREELLQNLRAKGEARSLEIWRQAEAEAARLQREGSLAIEQQREETSAGFERSVAEQTRPILLQAEREARSIRSAARRELAETLYHVACEEVGQLRGKMYPELFAALVAELPPLAWRRVLVAPQDRDLARSHFPEAEVDTDRQLAGGLKAVDQSGRLLVDNSLEKRLERAWPKILPDLVKACSLKEKTP